MKLTSMTGRMIMASEDSGYVYDVLLDMPQVPKNICEKYFTPWKSVKTALSSRSTNNCYDSITVARAAKEIEETIGEKEASDFLTYAVSYVNTFPAGISVKSTNKFEDVEENFDINLSYFKDGVEDYAKSLELVELERNRFIGDIGYSVSPDGAKISAAFFQDPRRNSEVLDRFGKVKTFNRLKQETNCGVIKKLYVILPRENSGETSPDLRIDIDWTFTASYCYAIETLKKFNTDYLQHSLSKEEVIYDPERKAWFEPRYDENKQEWVPTNYLIWDGRIEVYVDFNENTNILETLLDISFINPSISYFGPFNKKAGMIKNIARLTFTDKRVFEIPLKERSNVGNVMLSIFHNEFSKPVYNSDRIRKTLKKVMVSSTVPIDLMIGFRAFYLCEKLEEFIVSKKVTIKEIRSQSFYHTALKYFHTKNGLKSIGDEVFRGTQLKEFVIPRTVEEASYYILPKETIKSICILGNDSIFRELAGYAEHIPYSTPTFMDRLYFDSIHKSREGYMLYGVYIKEVVINNVEDDLYHFTETFKIPILKNCKIWYLRISGKAAEKLLKLSDSKVTDLFKTLFDGTGAYEIEIDDKGFTKPTVVKNSLVNIIDKALNHDIRRKK
jgi:hypothetical protein